MNNINMEAMYASRVEVTLLILLAQNAKTLCCNRSLKQCDAFLRIEHKRTAEKCVFNFQFSGDN
jgi:hypothetical protein